MTLQSTGPISLGDIQTEFGGGNPISISEYYRGGQYVSSVITQLPNTNQISIGDFYGLSNILSMGIFTNGSSNYGLNFTNESTFNLNVSTTEAHSYPACYASLIKGYVSGGADVTGSHIQGIALDTLTAFTLATTMTTVRYGVSSLNSGVRGYAAGGYSTAGFTDGWAVVDGIIYASETSFTSTAIPSVAHGRYWAGSYNSTTTGYIVGGKGANGPVPFTARIVYNSMISLIFSTGVTANIGSTITYSASGHGCHNSTTTGYVFGGADANNVANTVAGCSFSFSTLTTAATTVSLTANTAYIGGVNSLVKGYLGGGQTSTGAAVSTIHQYTYSTASGGNLTATLPAAITAMNGFQSGGIL